MTAPLSREQFEKLKLESKVVVQFGQHLDSFVGFLCAASGHPKMKFSTDDCCEKCGAPERAFRATLRLLAYSERE